MPSGGSGNIEYLWLSSTTGCPTSTEQAIPGATGPTYDPGFIEETTYFIRCSRREGCTTWIGESNCVVKTVDTGCGAETASVGDRVWMDNNENGIQDNEEPGLAGVWIFLQDEFGNNIPGKVTVSGQSGEYAFDDLDAGTYRIRFANPGGVIPTTQDLYDAVDDYLKFNGTNFTCPIGEWDVSNISDFSS